MLGKDDFNGVMKFLQQQFLQKSMKKRHEKEFFAVYLEKIRVYLKKKICDIHRSLNRINFRLSHPINFFVVIFIVCTIIRNQRVPVAKDVSKKISKKYFLLK